MTHGEDAYSLFEAALGKPEGTGTWLEITQERVNAFAEVTEDRQFIHIDPEMSAKFSPYGVTIAHGFLTLSLLSYLVSTIEQPLERAVGAVAGVNYGFEKVRFISPVKVGASIRASSVISSVDLKDPNTVQLTRTVTIEIEGETKPAVVADWISRVVYSPS